MFARGGGCLAVALALLAPAGCSLPEEAEIEGDAPEVGATSQAIAVGNGILINGAAGNGLHVNGLSVNGLHGNGIAINGIAINGIAINGIAINGIGVNGIGVNGIGVNGVLPNGIGVNGIGVNGIGVNGIGVNGLHVNGIGVNGIGVNGIAVDGFAINGLYVDGLAASGVAQNGLYVNGAALARVGLMNLAINGATAATAIKVGLASGAIGNLTTTTGGQAEQLRDRVMPYLAFCALPASTTGRNPSLCSSDAGCVMVKDHAGASRYYWGAKGYAPEWRTGALSAAGSDRLEGCLKQACVERGGDCQKGMALNAQQEAQLEVLLRYLVSCALPAYSGAQPITAASCSASAGCATIKSSSGVAKFYPGAMGLAPEWRSGPLGASAQQRVSACLGARTNASGETVLISMRGMGLGVGPLEKNRFRRHEGAFYGNLFGATPSINACEVEGGEMAGRVCADGQCGFTQTGACKTACSAASSSGTFDVCGGSHTEVLNTFLPFQKAASGGNMSACAIGADGRPSCWGEGDNGALGDGTTTDRLTSARAVSLPASAFAYDQIVNGPLNAFARRADGTLWAWGEGTAGQMGNGQFVNRTTPVQVPLSSVIDVSAQGNTACALTADGTGHCWGKNTYGQVGDGTTTHRATPYRLSVLGQLAQLESGNFATCALKLDGTVWCWGRNDYGQVGDGTTVRRAAPVPLTTLGGRAVQIAMTYHNGVALLDDGTVWTWGEASYGQRGTGSHDTAAQLSPRKVMVSSTTALTRITQVTAANEFMCALDRDRKIWCWGLNYYGDSGIAWGSKRSYATRITSFSGQYAALRANTASLYATRVDGAVQAVGWNTHGQLGDRTATERRAPVRMTMMLAPGNAACDFGESSVLEPADCAAPEVCTDALDNDGDGVTDCADPGCAGEAVCAAP